MNEMRIDNFYLVLSSNREEKNVYDCQLTLHLAGTPIEEMLKQPEDMALADE